MFLMCRQYLRFSEGGGDVKKKPHQHNYNLTYSHKKKIDFDLITTPVLILSGIIWQDISAAFNKFLLEFDGVEACNHTSYKLYSS